jgi:hypothetical protein
MNVLPSIPPSQARLPQTYEAARRALDACQSVDECKEWADKAAALASYARQSEDETLLKMAARIRARATRRAGELLAQISTRGARTDLTSGGQPPEVTRTDAARDAGMSSHQQKQAVRVASIPGDDFEQMVEGDAPPTLAALAMKGIKARPQPVMDLKGRNPREFNRAMHFLGAFEDYALAAEKMDLGVLSFLTEAERRNLRAFIGRIDAIHDRIITRI